MDWSRRSPTFNPLFELDAALLVIFQGGSQGRYEFRFGVEASEPYVAGRSVRDIMGAEVPMIQTVEAVIDADGHVRLLGEVRVDTPRRALVTVLEEPAIVPGEAALLAEAALANDWSRPEEDAAWSHLQPAK